MRHPLHLARPGSLLLTTLTLGVSRHLSSRTVMEAAATTVAEDRERLQRHLDAVDLQASPRVELTYGSEATGNGDTLQTLAVLDSSFNPPTRAHLHLLADAASQLGLSNSLLLLAKQNADKPVVGASLVQRLEMMDLIAAAADPRGSMVCGVTAHPLFVDKASALRSLCPDGARVAVLVGFDTWVRIIDAKYYADGGLEAALRRIFDAVEVVVASRDPSSAPNLEGSPMSTEEQERVVMSLPADVTRGRVHFLQNSPQMAPLSSSAIRKALAATAEGDGAATSAEGSGGKPSDDGLPPHVREMLPAVLHAYVEAQYLYREG